MKYLISIFMVAVSTLTAQTSFGIREPKNTANISSYKLPSWHYSTLAFHVRGDAIGDYYIKDSDKSPHSTGAHTFFIGGGDFLFFKENEQQTLDLTIGIYSRLLAAKTTTRYNKPPNTKVGSFKDYGILNFSSGWRRYLRHNNFFDFNAIGAIQRYAEDSKTERKDVDVKTFNENRNINDIQLGIGYGIGRLRNVTPVIQALRIRERLSALNKNIELTNQDIERLAQHLAKVSGYHRIFDRYDKYFWRDLADIANMSELSAFEQFYIRDALLERIGQRYHGWIISAGLNFHHTRNSDIDVHHTSDLANDMSDDGGHISTDFRYTKSNSFGPYASLRWANNFTLRHQLSVQVYLSLDANLEQENRIMNLRDSLPGYHPIPGTCGGIKYKNNNSLSCEYLWALHDRVLWTNTLNAELTVAQYSVEGFVSKPDSKIKPSDRGLWQNYYFDSSFEFYIENDFVLSLNFRLRRHEEKRSVFRCTSVGSPDYYYSDKYGFWDWAYNIQFTYYLDRKLF